MRTLPTLLALGLLAAAPARAALYDVTFTGTVNTQRNTSFSIGQLITGNFDYDSVEHRFTSFTVGGVDVLAPYDSIVSTTPGINPYTAIYEAQTSAVQQGGNLNQTFALDLEAKTTFPTNDPLALLTNVNQLSTNLAPFSNFGYYIGDANGGNVHAVNATLTPVGGVSVTTVVPEPASLGLLLAPAFGLLALRRRR